MWALINSIGTTLYIILIASFMYFLENVLNTKTSIFIPVVMLMLLVFSVALVGALIFGRPAIWYLEGKKKEGISLFISTRVIFLMALIIIFLSCPDLALIYKI
ncbi:hypothetical protein CO155_01705 [Candidatus Pacearchaeota archaeon CG_4_9_14_3_um_filter_35_19]|nr:MAG: hypothetical protein CO155_01705 [Candidatus Pacearchaeota archaeon CG_4_9_14_3_um_filter_35_19]